MTQNGSTFISCIRMANSGSSRYSSEIDDDYDLSLSTSLSTKVSEEICLSSLPLEMEVRPYRFKPDQESDLPSTTSPITDCDIDDGVHCTTVSESSFVVSMWKILTGVVDRYKMCQGCSVSSARMTYLCCHVPCVLIISARAVAVRSCLHRENRFVNMRWSK